MNEQTNQENRKRQKPSWAEDHLGIKKPRSFILNAAALDGLEDCELTREDIKQNRVRFEFPDGLAKLSLRDECWALTQLNDFDAMFDITMQMLVGRSVIIYIKHYNGVETELCHFQVVDKNQDLRAIEVIDEYPCLILWMTEMIGGMLLKKYPAPLKDALPPEAPGKKGSGIRFPWRKKTTGVSKS